jgi:hypothetical protein
MGFPRGFFESAALASALCFARNRSRQSRTAILITIMVGALPGGLE